MEFPIAITVDLRIPWTTRGCCSGDGFKVDLMLSSATKAIWTIDLHPGFVAPKGLVSLDAGGFKGAGS